MSAADLVVEVERAGGALVLDGEALKVRAFAPLPEDLLARLRSAKADVIVEQKGRQTAFPRIDPDGTLAIPFAAGSTSSWWLPEGRSILATLLDLDAAPGIVRRHLDPERLEWLEERSAILEHEAGLCRVDAEREALRQLADRED